MKTTIRRPGGTVEVELNPSGAIKAFCTECMGWETHPSECASEVCPLYHFRGKSSLHLPKRKISEESRAKAAERMRSYHANRNNSHRNTT
jgi:hypothetical protein